MTDKNRWILVIQDTGDGSGDGIVELPDDLMEAAGWVLGDVLNLIEQVDGGFLVEKITGSDGGIEKTAS